jgi:hypothetical protein
MKLEHAALAALIVTSATAAPVTAQGTGAVSIHGFGGWAYGRTDNANRYGSISSEDGEFNNYDLALNVAATLSDEISVHTQVNWNSNVHGQTQDLDYAFAQFAPTGKFQLRMGKVISPFGLYTETYDVGTLRPFYLLPQSMYAGPGFVSKSYLGAGISGEFPLSDGKWALGYDVFGGQMEFQDWYSEFPVGFDPDTGAPQTAIVKNGLVGHDLVGLKLNIATPVEGLSVGGSYLRFDVDATFDDESYGIEDPYQIFATHLELQRDRLTLRSEMFWLKPGADASRFAVDADGGYIEASYKLASAWQVAVSLEKHEEETQPGSQAVTQLLEHKALGLALSYWASSSVVLKANYYYVDGNLFSRPEYDFTAAVTGALEEKTNVFILGTQFSF